MDQRTIQAVAGPAAQAAVPLIQMGVRSYFESKQISKQQEHEVRMAERRNSRLQQAATQQATEEAAQNQQTAATADAVETVDTPDDALGQPVSEQNPSPEVAAADAAAGVGTGVVENGGPDTVLDVTDRLRQQTECGFCHAALDKIENTVGDDPRLAKQAAQEMQEYVSTEQELLARDAPPEVIEQRMDTLTADWQAVPKLMAEEVTEE